MSSVRNIKKILNSYKKLKLSEYNNMKFLFIFIITLLYCSLSFTSEIYQNYVQAYGEGPLGQYLTGLDTVRYTEEDAVEYAREEIMEFLSGMIYGYNFIYKVENKINNTKGYFDLIPIARLKNTDKNISLTQLQEKGDSLKIQALYRLSLDQKSYLKGFQSSLAKMSIGESSGSWVDKWDKRLDVYKDALKNAIFNEARKRYKSRPLFIKGKLLLIKSPLIMINSGQWKVRVKVHVIIKEVKYRDVY